MANSLSAVVNNHDLPDALIKYPVLFKIFRFIESFIFLRNWYIGRSLKKEISKLQENNSVLDAGCGSSNFLLRFASKYKNLKFEGIDISKRNIAAAQSYSRRFNICNINLFHGDLDNYEFKKSYNLILCFTVLQFSKDKNLLLRKFYNSLEENGQLLLYLPINGKRIFPFYKRLSENLFRDVNYNHVNKLKSDFTLESVTKQLDELNFNITSIIQTYGFFGKIYYEIFSIFELFVKKYHPLFLILVIPISLLWMPFQLILMVLDFTLPVKNGNGVLITAKK